MVDQKMYELGTRKSTIRDVFEYGRKLAAAEGEDKVFDFSLGNPNVPAPEYIRDAAVDILQTMEPSAIHGYTIAPGAPAVRRAIAKSINDRFGMEISEKNLFMTAGAAAACTICFKALFEEDEPIADMSDCTLFRNGFAIYKNGTGRTVVWLPYCRSFTYYFNKLRDSEKDTFSETYEVPDGFLAARLDEFALVSGDRAEVAAAEAAPVRDDRVLDHVVRRDALTLVAGVRKFGERQVPAGVHLLGRGGRIGRIHLHVAVADGLDERLRVKHIRLNLYFMEILSKRNLILATLFERM